MILRISLMKSSIYLKSIVAVFFSVLLIFESISLCYAISSYNQTYDGNGNLISGDRNYYEYDSFNQLIRVKQSNSNGPIIAWYFYDQDGNRIKKVTLDLSGNNVSTYYISKDFVRIVNSSGSYDTSYYYDEDALVARQDPNGQKYYYHPNQLGSTELVTNQSASVVEETHYLPYGEILSGGLSKFLFTGKEKDTESGLVYYGARYYNPSTTRFTQPDSVISDIYNPQSLNRYAYTENNPISRIDPSGHNPILAIGATWALVGAVFSAGYSIYTQLRDNHSVDPWKVGKAALTGAVSGFVGGVTLGFGVAAEWGTFAALEVSSIIQGRFDKGVTNYNNGQPISQGILNPSEVGKDMTLAAAFHVVGGAIGSKGYSSVADEPLSIGKSSISNSEAISESISNGHAFKHVEKGEFRGIFSKKSFKEYIQDVINNPSESKNGNGGRIAFWDDKTKAIVIYNPKDSDLGTAFVPSSGYTYFKDKFK